MTEARDIHGTAMKNGSATLMARVVGNDGLAVTRADIAEIRYSVFLLDDFDPDARSAVAGHDNAALDAADVVFDTLQNDARWTVDSTGYNFRHALDVSVHPALPVAGRRYLVEYRLTPTAGQPILVRFRLNVI